MSTSYEQNTPEASTEERRKGTVLAIVSGKGGPGKTVMAASFAYALKKSGKKVLVIDTDFRTRGMSYYLIGDLAEQPHLDIKKESSMKDILVRGIPVEKVRPAVLQRAEGLEYDILLADRALHAGGKIDPEAFTSSEEFSEKYFGKLESLCERFREEYDYVIIDTRGGYDYTSAIPALVADGFVVVLELDRLSLNQTTMFLNSIGKMSEKFPDASATLKGFISNKWIYPPEDDTLLKYLQEIHGGLALGNIPLDRNVIINYGNKILPYEGAPGSDFAEYSLRVTRKLFQPDKNSTWTQEEQEGFERVYRKHHRKWQRKKEASVVRGLLTGVQILSLLIAAGSFLMYRGGNYRESETVLLVSVLVFLTTVFLRILDKGYHAATRRFGRIRAVAIMTLPLLLFFGIFYLVVFEAPRTFSNEEYLKRITKQGIDILGLEAQNRELEQSAQLQNENNQLLTEDVEAKAIEIDQIMSENVSLRNDVIIKEKDATDWRTRYNSADVQAKRFFKQIEELSGELSEEKKKGSDLARDLRRSNSDLSAKNLEILSLNNDRENLQSSLQKATKDQTEIRSDVVNLCRLLDRANDQSRESTGVIENPALQGSPSVHKVDEEQTESESRICKKYNSPLL